jgi:hypothetical protein
MIILMELRKNAKRRKVCDGQGCRRKACIGCLHFQQTIEELKEELTPKRAPVWKRDHFTEMLTITTGMSMAVLFPYVELKYLFVVLPSLNRKIRRLFMPSSGPNKSISIKQFLTVRLGPYLDNFS